MSYNTFGHLFRVTTFGESHGPAIGCVVDGCPPRIPLTEATSSAISTAAVRASPVSPRSARSRTRSTFFPACSPRRDRRPGDDRHADRAADRECRPALQGLFRDQGQVPARPRRFHLSGEIRHPRLSRRRARFARETATRVAAGAVARQVLPDVTIRGSLVQMGTKRIDRANFGWAEVGNNPFFCADGQGRGLGGPISTASARMALRSAP